MVSGRYVRIDGNNSPSYSLGLIGVLFVSTCLLGAWMALSSSVGPVWMGVSVEQFVGIMPWKTNRSKGNLSEDPLKVIKSQNSLQYTGIPPISESENVTLSEAREDDSKEKEFNIKGGSTEQKVAEEPASKFEGHNMGAKQTNEGEDVLHENFQNVKTLENGKPSSSESLGEIKQPEQTKAKIEENGADQDKKIPENEGITMMQDGKIDQSEKPSQDQTKILILDGPLMSNETPARVVQEPTQTGELEKAKDLEKPPSTKPQTLYKWKVCNVTAGPDYIPCLDNIQAIKKLRTTKHYEHRERHCPDEAPTCLVDLPEGYRTPIRWPKSRDMIWFTNVPHTKLVQYKGQQNWVKIYGRYLTFPGGGTQFKHGVKHYIDFIQKTVHDMAWGKRSRVILDVGCGVASFGGYLFEKDVLTMSLAPKDEHEAQVQFALERGIPAILAVMGSKRLPFPAMVFDVVHCARCRVPWHVHGGKLLLELDRVLRPGGYFVWSATPVYRKGAEDASIWIAMSKLTKSMCWELVQVGRDKFNGVSAAIFKKPSSNTCYEGRPQNDPPICEASDDRDAAWYTPLQACIHKMPISPLERGTQWPARWPLRLERPPFWLKGSIIGADDKRASKKFIDNSSYWKRVVSNSYLNELGIDWSFVRNIMDMNASYGGFASALTDLKAWVMNVVPVNSTDTLPIIYERGLFGIYHDWCESFSTYPRSYDLLHADRLFSNLKKRCKFVSVMAEVDRILRPGRWLIVRDDLDTIAEVESLAKLLQWKIQFNQFKENEGLLCAQKTRWRPSEVETIPSAIA